MFDSMWGSKFCNKCKNAVKCIRTRAVLITRKKQANVAYLKQVVANLLARGEEGDAFRRMDDLIVEINRTACYDVIQNFCGLILSQLPEMQKQRECSQEILEAMATIIFAAARFADLPELCDLRRIFTERYGDHIESAINAEFVEKIETTSFSKEKKLQVMQNVADEFSVRWNSMEFGQKQSNVPSTLPDKPKKTELKHNGDEASPALDNELKDETALKRKKWPPANVILKQQRQIEPRDIHATTTKKNDYSEEPWKKKNLADFKPENDEPYQSNKVISPNGYTRHNKYKNCRDELKDREKPPEVQDGLDPACCKPDKQGSQARCSVEKPLNMVPPYMHTNGTKNKYSVEKVEGNSFAPHIKSDGSVNGYTMKERSLDDLPCEANQRYEKRTALEKEPDKPVNDKGRAPYMIPPYVKPNFKGLSVLNDRKEKISVDADCETEVTYHLKEGGFDDEKPKPVSVRRKFSKPQDIPKDDTVINGENVNIHAPGGRRRHSSRRTAGVYDDSDSGAKIFNRELRTQVDDEMSNAIDFGKLLHRTSSDRGRHVNNHTNTVECDEEVVMDRLLMHYSKKGKALESGKERRRPRTHLGGHVVNVDQVVEFQRHDSHGTYVGKEAKQPPGRSFSFLEEPVKPAASEAPTRSISMQPDHFSPRSRRVHPRMPDYDQLAARLAALRRI